MEAVCTGQEEKMSVVQLEGRKTYTSMEPHEKRLASYIRVEGVLARHGVYTSVRDEKGYE